MKSKYSDVISNIVVSGFHRWHLSFWISFRISKCLDVISNIRVSDSSLIKVFGFHSWYPSFCFTLEYRYVWFSLLIFEMKTRNLNIDDKTEHLKIFESKARHYDTIFEMKAGHLLISAINGHLKIFEMKTRQYDISNKARHRNIRNVNQTFEYQSATKFISNIQGSGFHSLHSRV